MTCYLSCPARVSREISAIGLALAVAGFEACVTELSREGCMSNNDKPDNIIIMRGQGIILPIEIGNFWPRIQVYRAEIKLSMND